MDKRLLVVSVLLGLSACSGSDDAPTTLTPPIQVTNTPATFSGALTAQFSISAATANGTVTVTDPDAGEANLIAQTNIAGSYGALTLAANGEWTYELDTQNAALIALPLNAELSDTFAISSSDGAASQIEITLTGINEVATFGEGNGINALVITNQQVDAVTGTLSVSDVDTNEAAFIPQTNINALYGTFSITALGAWTYSLDTANSSVIDLPNAASTIVDSIPVSSIDGSMGSIQISINGTNSQTTTILTKGAIGSNDEVPSVNCTTTVSSTSQLEDAASFSMTPGDTICLADGSYSGLELNFGGAGTAEAPITIAAQTPGSVTIGGEVFVGMTGSYAVLQGFIFKDGTIDNSLLQTRANSNTACNNCRITENVFMNMDAGITDSTKWFQIYGSGNRFDHNWVSGKTSRGALFVIERGSAPGTEDRTQVDHNYFGDRPPKDGLAYADGSDNEYEGIRIGSSDTHTSDSFAVVEHNYFEAIDGEAEVISIKAGNVTIQHNTIRNSRGSIVSRHGEGSIITNNFVLGDGNPFSGGIRVVDANHEITNNYIAGARYLSTNFNGGLLVSNSDGSTTNGYQTVENVLVANNTVVDSVNSINLYAGNRSQRPDSVYFVNNVVADAIGPVIRNADTLPSNSNFVGNYVFGQSFSDEASVSALNGFTFADPALEASFGNAASELMRPSSNSPALSAEPSPTIGEFSLPSVDMDGQTRTDATLSGADENLSQSLDAPALRGVLSADLVGPLSYNAPAPSFTVTPVNINNADFASGDLSAWTATNAVLVTSAQDSFSGNSSAQVMGSASSISQTLSVQQNTNYTLSAVVAGEGQLAAVVGNNTVSTDNTSSDFSFKSLSFNSGSSTSVDIVGQVDNSVLNEVTILNPNFDNDQNDWVINEGTGIGQVQDSDNSSSSVEGSIKFTHNDADSGSPYQPYIAQTVAVEPNTDYTLSMYVLLKSSDAQDATVLFGAHTGSAISGGIFDSANVIASKNSVYANASEDNDAEDSFRRDTLVFNSGTNTTFTIFAQYQSTAGGDIRIDEFSLSSSGSAASNTTATFDDFRLVSHPSIE